MRVIVSVSIFLLSKVKNQIYETIMKIGWQIEPMRYTMKTFGFLDGISMTNIHFSLYGQ